MLNENRKIITGKGNKLSKLRVVFTLQQMFNDKSLAKTDYNTVQTASGRGEGSGEQCESRDCTYVVLVLRNEQE